MENEIQEQLQALDTYLNDYVEGANLDVHPFEVADLLLSLKKVNEQIYVDYLNKLPKDLLAEVIMELPKSDQEDIYTRFGQKTCKTH